MVGSAPLALMVLADAKPYLLLLAIGAIATGAWLVDGRRYLGPGTVALGLGIGLALARDFDQAKYELPLVLVGIGVPLTVIRFVNPGPVLGAAGLLIYAALSGAIRPDPGPNRVGMGIRDPDDRLGWHSACPRHTPSGFYPRPGPPLASARSGH
jgi:hypothetical protein